MRPVSQPIHPLIVHIGRTRAFRRIAPRLLPPCDRMVHRLTHGRWMPSRLFLPTLVLTTVGHRTGRLRTTPLCAYRSPDGSWLVAATNFGRPYHPAWSTNLIHHPKATVAWQGTPYLVTAHRLTAAEHAAARPHVIEMLPLYDHYHHTAQREVRTFRLTPD